MGQLRSALSAALLQGSGPAEALELLDRFAARLPGALASTAACVVLDWETGSVRWARAGHPPPVVVTPDGARLLDGAGAGAGPVLGVPDRSPYDEGRAHLDVGTTLLLYTDGLVERRGEHLDAGLARLTAAAARFAAAGPERMTRELLAAVLADTAQPDDVAVLAARLLPAPLRGSLSADPTLLSGVRREVTAWARAAGVPDETVEDLELALGEALANAVEHAYPEGKTGECRWSVERELDGSLQVCVEDRGTWRPPPADRGHRGRGLELIGALAADVDVRRTAAGGARTGTTVTFRIPASKGAVPPAVPAPRAPGLEDGPARVTVAAGPAGPVLAVHGELDLDSVRAVGTEIRERLAALPPGTAVTLDLGGTSYLASAGVGLLLELHAHARARGLRLGVRCDPHGVPARVLGLTGVDSLLPGA
jgi:anti-anti-sigma factor